jgi:hypothetical protein
MKMKLSPSRSIRVPEQVIKKLDLIREIAVFRAEELSRVRLGDYKDKKNDPKNDSVLLSSDGVCEEPLTKDCDKIQSKGITGK